jgi:formate dehydrogenase subunit delta
MSNEDLVRMANQIAQFFAPYPQDEAIDGVRDHLEKFWTPAMRRELTSLVDTPNADGERVHPLVVQAVHRWSVRTA